MPIVREMYVFTAVERPKRLGHNAWLGLGILIVEWNFIFKFGEDEIAKAGCASLLDGIRSFWLLLQLCKYSISSFTIC